MKRSPLRRRSARTERFDRELRRVTPALVNRSGGRCELADDTCSGEFHRHHRKMRSQGGDNQIDNLLLVCDRHHRYIHANPAESYDNGWLVRGNTTTD